MIKAFHSRVGTVSNKHCEITNVLFCWAEITVARVISTKEKGTGKYFITDIKAKQHPDTTENISLSIWMTSRIYEAGCIQFNLRAEMDAKISGWMRRRIEKTDR